MLFRRLTNVQCLSDLLANSLISLFLGISGSRKGFILLLIIWSITFLIWLMSSAVLFLLQSACEPFLKSGTRIDSHHFLIRLSESHTNEQILWIMSTQVSPIAFRTSVVVLSGLGDLWCLSDAIAFSTSNPSEELPWLVSRLESPLESSSVIWDSA